MRSGRVRQNAQASLCPCRFERPESGARFCMFRLSVSSGRSWQCWSRFTLPTRALGWEAEASTASSMTGSTMGCCGAPRSPASWERCAQAGASAAWLLVAFALASWAVGDTIWSIRFGVAAVSSSTSISDVFWLAWYPLIVAALALVVAPGPWLRAQSLDRRRRGDAAPCDTLGGPGPAAGCGALERHGAGRCARLCISVGRRGPGGAVLGVFALMAWRPGRMWLALGVALMAMGVADATYSVQALGTLMIGASTMRHGRAPPFWSPTRPGNRTPVDSSGER